ncbi:uncharacterized protein LOC109806258 [Cajanus cajan]|uniref:uncharacterized protein LOC109806258 n=1 Tax=Cajanus cajan TaxID=3821 RepID=UPI00098D9104|nr:uncharacterized protein LOC109806258 [Cajanus cajan]
MGYTISYRKGWLGKQHAIESIFGNWEELYNKLPGKLKEELIRVLHEYKDCFAWDYDEMPGLDRGLVEHRLPMMPGKKPVKQSPRRFALEVIEKIKEEIEGLLKAKFIRTSRYVEWISNIVLIIKKNGKLRVCINFRDLNTATPKDEYPMPIAETMIDVAAGALGVYEWVMMPFGMKNAGATYQREMNLIFHDLIESMRVILLWQKYMKASVEHIKQEVEQKDIIDFVEDHIITRFGIPQTIITDQDTVFTGRKVAQYAQS